MLSPIVLALALSAAGVSARRELSVSLNGAQNFADVSHAVISATVKNTGDETVSLLNHPNSVLSKGPTDVFAISHSSGKAPRFQGEFAKYIPKADKSVTTLSPGQSITLNHSLADAYDFSGSGEGAYAIAVPKTFYIVADGGVQKLSAKVTPHTATLTGNLVKRAPSPPPLQRRATFIGCSAAQQTALNAAASNANGLVQNAATYVATHAAGTVTPRYKTWFGSNPTVAQYSQVAFVYSTLSATSYGTYTYECVPTTRCAGLSDDEAFTTPSTIGHFFVCPAFFSAPTTGTESQAGILVHLGTHWKTVGDTGHWAIGDTDSLALAQSNPDLAVLNADSYEFFAENSPPLA